MTKTKKARTITIRQYGLSDYQMMWQAMQAFTRTRDENTVDEIWLLQHPPVYTLGLNGKPEHILNAGDIPIVPVDRGGQVTYHGPGQLVAYLLIDLKRLGLGIRELVTMMEQSIIELLATDAILANSRKDAPGVYVNGAKIAALGLRIKRGCSYHGLALNVDMDLEPFSRINPCGYAGMAVTQVKDLVGVRDMLAVEHLLLQQLCQRLGCTAVLAADTSEPCHQHD